MLQDYVEDIPLLRSVGHTQEMAHHGFHGIADPAPVLLGHHMVREQHAVEEAAPDIGHPAADPGRLHVFRELFLEGNVESCHDRGGDPGGLTADVTILMGQHLVQEVQDHQLLLLLEIAGVFFDDGQEGAHMPPVLLAADVFQQADEGDVMSGGVHDLQVLRDGEMLEGLHELIRPHQGIGYLLLRPAEAGSQIGGYAQGDQVILEVLQLRVHLRVAAPLGVVHIVQLAEDDVVGFLQGPEADLLRAVLQPDALDAEVGVDQDQALHAQVLELQIPYRVGGGDGADGIEAEALGELIGIVIMQVWDAAGFLGTAAVFSDVVQDRGA